jgi:phosphoglucosamine mutase
VRERGADLGIALDGDADRVIMCDSLGNILDGDSILAICAIHLNKKGMLAKNTIVGTKMSNMGLELSLAERDIKLVRTEVGDRYVMEAMRREGYNLGGENSGHIIFLHHTTSGDGTLAALRVLSIMCQRGQPLSKICEDFTLLPQTIKNVRVMEKRPLGEMPSVARAIEDVDAKLSGKGRLLVRYSGTENIARVMVEGEDAIAIEKWACEIADAITAEIGTEVRC